MSNYNFDGSSDDGWDDRGDLSWNEHDWQQFLKRHEHEIARFIGYYNKLMLQPDHLDEIAHQMGWDSEDWSVGDPTLDDDDTPTGFDLREDEEQQRPEDFDPYTVQRHPVYVVVRGLYRVLRGSFESLMGRHSRTVDAQLAWRYGQVLQEGEFNAILAVQSLDMGDYTLAVVQLKQALGAINRAFSTLSHVAEPLEADGQAYLHDARIRLFDLREVCLRVMGDCREEIRRHWRDRGNE